MCIYIISFYTFLNLFKMLTHFILSHDISCTFVSNFWNRYQLDGTLLTLVGQL